MQLDISDIVKCKTCKGVGTIDVSSHDCWGKAEWDTRTCCVCKGFGFILPDGFVKEIKEKLNAAS